MEGILDLLNSDLGKQIVSGVAGSTGTDTNKTSSVLTMALPIFNERDGKKCFFS
jgi:hypothetical protein